MYFNRISKEGPRDTLCILIYNDFKLSSSLTQGFTISLMGFGRFTDSNKLLIVCHRQTIYLLIYFVIFF